MSCPTGLPEDVFGADRLAGIYGLQLFRKPSATQGWQKCGNSACSSAGNESPDKAVTSVPGLELRGGLKQLAPPPLQNYKGCFSEEAHCRVCVSLLSG